MDRFRPAGQAEVGAGVSWDAGVDVALRFDMVITARQACEPNPGIAFGADAHTAVNFTHIQVAFHPGDLA